MKPGSKPWRIYRISLTTGATVIACRFAREKAARAELRRLQRCEYPPGAERFRFTLDFVRD